MRRPSILRPARARSLAAPGLASALLLCAVLPATAASGDSVTKLGPVAPSTCVERYHDALATLAETSLPRIDAAWDEVHEGAADMPGGWLVEPALPRGTVDRDAMRATGRLIAAKGRAAWTGRRNEEWIAKRIRTELSDYFGQDASPFLCSGVPGYLKILDRYVARLADDGRVDASAHDAIKTAAHHAVRAARSAMRPVPRPRFAPGRPGIAAAQAATLASDSAALVAALRPAHGWRAAIQMKPAAFGPFIDTDLPPLSVVDAATDLRSQDTRLAVIEDLMNTAARRGFVASRQSARPMGPFRRPVLARLADAGATLPTIGDELVRERLRAALARIEALDYLAHRPQAGSDALVAAFRATFADIEAAVAAARAEPAIAEPKPLKPMRSAERGD